MKGNKACGTDLIHIEVRKKMGEEGIVFSQEGIERNVNIWHTIFMEAELSNTAV